MLLTTTLLDLLAFCRVVIGLVFAISSINKTRNIAQFQQTIARFDILPASLSRPLALSFIGSEFAVVVLIAVGGFFLLPGFTLAMFLLLVFCGALLSVLARRIKISCNCFGSNEKQVSSSDLWRNGGFLLCALGGCVLFMRMNILQGNTSLPEWIFAGLGAIVFVSTWLHLEGIVQLFRLN